MSIVMQEFSGEVKGCGSNRICAFWYARLPQNVKDKIVAAGFGEFVKCLVPSGRRDRKLLIALAERWWDTTHTFHFDNIGEMTMTPKDFSAITGIPVSGKPLEYDMDAHTKKAQLLQLCGKRLADLANQAVTYTQVRDAHWDWVVKTPADEDKLVRVFLLCLLGSTLFAGRTNTINLWFLPSLKVITEIGTYNWGGPALSSLYLHMDSLSRGKTESIAGFWRAWEVSPHSYKI